MSLIRSLFPPVALAAALTNGGLGADACAEEARDTAVSAETPAATAPQTWLDDEDLDWIALNTVTVPAGLTTVFKRTKRFTPSPSDFSSLKKNHDGSMAVTVGKNLPTEWDSKIGIDLRLPPAPAITYQPGLLPGQTAPSPSGAAWAKLTVRHPVPLALDRVTFDARIDPIKEESRLSATLSRSVPIGSDFRVTLQNRYAIGQTLPVDAAALDTVDAPTWSTANSVRLNILPSRTSLSAGVSMSSSDEQWLHSFSAEQKLFDGSFSITASARETTTGEIAKSMTARFKHSW